MRFSVATRISIVIMSNIFRESANFKNSRFVHVVPEGIEIVGSFEIAIANLFRPVVLCIFVKEVNPRGVSRPAIPKVDIVGHWVTNEYIRVVGSWLGLIFKNHTILPNEVVLYSFNVGINDYCDASV